MWTSKRESLRSLGSTRTRSNLLHLQRHPCCSYRNGGMENDNKITQSSLQFRCVLGRRNLEGRIIWTMASLWTAICRRFREHSSAGPVPLVLTLPIEMELSVVRKSDFGEGGVLTRLDAEFVGRSLLRPEQALRRLRGADLAQVAQPYRGPKLNEAFAPAERRYHYVSIDDVDTTDGLTHSELIRYEERPSRAKYLLEPGDLLISNVRPNRNAVSLVTERLRGALASSGFTLVRSGRTALPAEYLFAFMKTPQFVAQMLRRNRGSMYPAVLPADVLGAWIPEPAEALRNQVVQGVRSSLAMQDEFFGLFGRAEHGLKGFLSQMGTPPSPFETRRSGADWTPVSSERFFAPGGSRRFDAEFFRGEYAEFEDGAKNWDRRFRLGELYSLRPGGGTKVGDDSVSVVRQGMLTNAGINWSAARVELGKLPSVADVQDGDVLLACTAHEVYYVGRRVDYVRGVPCDHNLNRAVSDVIVCRTRARPPTVPGAYLAAFLRSRAGLHQVQRCIRGLRGGHVYREDLEAHVYVPIPPSEWLQEFEHLMSMAESARNDSRNAMIRQIDAVEGWLADTGITVAESFFSR